MFQAVQIQIRNTYCRGWSLNVSGMFLFPWTLQCKQALGPSLYRCQRANVHRQFRCPAGPASIFSLLCLWSWWMLACMLHSGPCFGIVSPSCLELFRRGILAWHLRKARAWTRNVIHTHTHYLNISIFSAVVKYRWKAASPEATGRGSGRIYPSLRKVYTCCPPFFVLDLTATPIISEICHNPPSPFSSNITYDSNPNVERYGFIWKLFYSQDVKEGF